MLENVQCAQNVYKTTPQVYLFVLIIYINNTVKGVNILLPLTALSLEFDYSFLSFNLRATIAVYADKQEAQQRQTV